MKYDFTSFLDVSSQANNQISARCPFHDDRTPSFSANAESGLWRCFAGCGQGNYYQFLSRIASDPQSGVRISKTSKSKRYVRDEGFKTVATYEYMDTSGTIRLRITRQEKSSGEKRFFQEHLDDMGLWVKGGTDKALFPYLIHEWSKSESNLLFFVEGEKCADFLKAKGLDSTTVAGGSNKWMSSYARYFKCKKVIILPDNDEPGMKFGHDVFRSLYIKKDVETHLVELPGLGLGEDVIDWLSQNRTVADLLRLVPSSKE